MAPRPSKGNAYVYWVCQTRHNQGVKYCDCPRRNVETFEPIVLDAILDDILTPTNVMEFIAHIEAEVRDQSGFHIDLIDTIDKQLDDLEQRFNRLTDAYETGKLTLQVWEKRIDDLDEKKQQLADTKIQATAAIGHELRILQNPEAALCFAAELKLCLTECEPAQLKTLIRKFVKQVRFDHDKAIIDYKIPLPDDSQNSGKISREIDLTGRVRPIVPLGPQRWAIASSLFGLALTVALVFPGPGQAQEGLPGTPSDPMASRGPSRITLSWDDPDDDSITEHEYYQAQVATLVDAEPVVDDYFGWSLAMGGDVAVVGAPGNELEFDIPGSAYVFARE